MGPPDSVAGVDRDEGSPDPPPPLDDPSPSSSRPGWPEGSRARTVATKRCTRKPPSRTRRSQCVPSAAPESRPSVTASARLGTSDGVGPSRREAGPRPIGAPAESRGALPAAAQEAEDRGGAWPAAREAGVAAADGDPGAVAMHPTRPRRLWARRSEPSDRAATGGAKGSPPTPVRWRASVTPSAVSPCELPSHQPPSIPSPSRWATPQPASYGSATLRPASERSESASAGKEPSQGPLSEPAKRRTASSAGASSAGSSSPDASPAGPSSPDASSAGPSPDASSAGPSSPDASSAGPSSPDASSAGPSSPDASSAGPSSPDASSRRARASP